jgi:hypothetical protein
VLCQHILQRLIIFLWGLAHGETNLGWRRHVSALLCNMSGRFQFFFVVPHCWPLQFCPPPNTERVLKNNRSTCGPQQSSNSSSVATWAVPFGIS